MFLLRARMAVVSSVRACVCACVLRPSVRTFRVRISCRHRHTRAHRARGTRHKSPSCRRSSFAAGHVCANSRRHRISARVCTVLCVCVGPCTRVHGDARACRCAQMHARPSHCSSPCQTLSLQSVFAKRRAGATRPTMLKVVG